MKKKAKAKRYEEGGGVESYEDTNAGMADAANTTPTTDTSDEDLSRGGKEPAVAPKQSFSQAFAAARKGGGNTFEFNGKKYTTDVAGSKSAAAPKASTTSAPISSGRGTSAGNDRGDYKESNASGRGTMAGTTAEDLDRYAAKKRVEDTIKKTTAVDKDTDYSKFVPAGGAGKVLTAAAKAIKSSAPAAEKAAELAGPQLRRYAQEQIGMNGPRISGGAAKALPKPSNNTASQSISAAERASAKNIDKIKSEAPNTFKNKPKNIRRGNDDEMGTEFKRGGTIGKKINGIAQRGKTRGKIR